MNRAVVLAVLITDYKYSRVYELYHVPSKIYRILYIYVHVILYVMYCKL